jgi:hypothetical protein
MRDQDSWGIGLHSSVSTKRGGCRFLGNGGSNRVAQFCFKRIEQDITRLIGIRSLPRIGLRLYECEGTGRGRKRPRLCLGAVDAGRRERGRWDAERKRWTVARWTVARWTVAARVSPSSQREAGNYNCFCLIPYRVVLTIIYTPF